MNREQLVQQINKKRSFLCVGLDTDLNKIPKHLLKEEDPVFAFNKAIIDATAEYCVAYKPNLAFYEALGAKGWESLEKTINYIPKDIFTIADAKRGDIGNTAASYAKTFYETFDFDSVTLAPYMGRDSIDPFLAYPDKWAIILALTSNESGSNFQNLSLKDGGELYREVLRQSSKWGTEENTMFVVGATKAEAITEIRKIIPNHFLLVPGVGAQGGSLQEVAKYGLTKECGLLVNSSRGIIYASNGEDFAAAATNAARTIQEEMEILINNY